MRCLALPVVVVSLVLVGCGSTESAEPGSTTTETQMVAPTTTASPDTSTTEASTTTTTTTATTTTVTTMTTTSTTAAVSVDPLVLRGDGLGAWMLGSDADTVVEGLTEVLGPPSTDTGWRSSEDEQSPVWGCPPPQARRVRWPDLTAYFHAFPDGTLPADFLEYYSPADGRPYFLGYQVGGDLRTAAGIGVGSTLAELRAAYGTDLVLFVEEYLLEWRFRVGSTGIRGHLSAAATGPGDTAEPEDATTMITGLSAGSTCFIP
jgi:hypothetical protein